MVEKDIDKLYDKVLTDMFADEWAMDWVETDGNRNYNVYHLRKSLETLGFDQDFILKCCTQGCQIIHDRQRGAAND